MGDAVEIMTASAVPPAAVWRAFREGFRDYLVPIELTEPQFAAMIAAEQIDLGASALALDAEGAPAGVALLAIRGDEGYCAGLGVSPHRRRSGLGRRLMAAILEEAGTRALRRVRLEVLDGNDAAHALYASLGFAPVRRLDVFRGPATLAAPPAPSPVLPLTNPETVWATFAAYHRAPPPWQRDLPTVRAENAAGLTGVASGNATRPDAYLLLREHDDVVAILDGGARAEIAAPHAVLAGLIGHVASSQPDRPLAAVNIPEDDPLNAALRACGVAAPLGQTELALALGSGPAGRCAA